MFKVHGPTVPSLRHGASMPRPVDARAPVARGLTPADALLRREYHRIGDANCAGEPVRVFVCSKQPASLRIVEDRAGFAPRRALLTLRPTETQ